MKKYMKNLILILLLVLCFLQIGNAQQNYDPQFSPFTGKVYKIPAREIHKGFSSNVEKSYEQIGEVIWDELNIPERQDSILIKGINRRTGFGIVFHAEMKITKGGWYQFSLNSDDGSRLWIDKKQIIYNDKLHGMTLVKETIELGEGTHPVKIWYYQGVADRFGIEFKSSFVKESNIQEIELHNNKFTFSTQSLSFDNNSAEISFEGKKLLTNFCEQLKENSFSKITIIGHTDAKGTNSFNEGLSLNRAMAVSQELANNFKGKVIEYVVIGRGESDPVATNETEEGRSENRRVEVIIE